MFLRYNPRTLTLEIKHPEYIASAFSLFAESNLEEIYGIESLVNNINIKGMFARSKLKAVPNI